MNNSTKLTVIQNGKEIQTMMMPTQDFEKVQSMIDVLSRCGRDEVKVDFIYNGRR